MNIFKMGEESENVFLLWSDGLQQDSECADEKI